MPQFLAHLHDIEPRTRRASHAMYAWRLRPPSTSGSSLLYGSSNGGEAGAGERLERLLELGHCENVALVVFRWYGGVKLGSDRWRCISSVAKEALERGGYLGSRGGANVQADSSPGRKKRR
ncbi:ribosomal protein S5 domain 2-like protein [Polyporus arcularius HHB13444]|uniref:Ribosomal protein S5 domain 2-like protein n=1 Tax=Polyporus arcularius HHB13444 TaxID=1314778 RepID=A0A5C3PH34_9APHY|nr:ribosomal protein S5 domain 2-like protein [Polyporus arcularius HHB13444]